MGELMWKQIIGQRRKLVFRLTANGIEVNPEGTGTRELAPSFTQIALQALSFTVSGRPVITDDRVLRAGTCVVFQGF